MYMEAVAPLAALLESTDDESFTIKEAIPMVQSAVRLLEDATQYHSILKEKGNNATSKPSAADPDERC